MSRRNSPSLSLSLSGPLSVPPHIHCFGSRVLPWVAEGGGTTWPPRWLQKVELETWDLELWEGHRAATPQTSQGTIAPGPLIEEGGLTEILPSLLCGEGESPPEEVAKKGQGAGVNGRIVLQADGWPACQWQWPSLSSPREIPSPSQPSSEGGGPAGL